MQHFATPAERRQAEPTIEVVAGISPALDDLAAAADPRHAFLRTAWYKAAGGSEARTLIATRADGRVISAIPTVGTGPGSAIRAVPGCYWPFRSFPIAADASDDELAALLGDAKARAVLGRVWRVGPVYADDPSVLRMQRIARRSGWRMLQRRIATSFLLDMATVQAAGTWPRTSTLKKNRYFERHLARHGALEWRFFSGKDWTSGLFDTLASVEAASWITSDTDGSDAKFLAPHHRRFWEAAARDPALASMMRAAVLFIGDKPAAFSFDLDVGEVKHAIANSFDQAFERHSPGKVLYYRNLVHALEGGTRLVDWGAGDAGYKSTIGAEQGPEILDLLFVRGPLLAGMLQLPWSLSGRR